MTRTALVTGAGGGIGSATVTALRTDGWRVIGVDRPGVDVEGCDRVEPCDVGADGAVAALFDGLSDEARLDVVVNNAAVGLDKALCETTDDDWRRVMDTNLRAAFQCIRHAAPLLATTRGAVVNVSSVHAVATSVNVAVYAVSKGAIVALTRSAAVELADQGVRCNAVLPGSVRTQMLEAGLDRRPHPDGPAGNLADLAARTPLGRVADPGEIAEVIVFLADGRRSSYVTGQTLVADGGALAHLSTE